MEKRVIDQEITLIPYYPCPVEKTNEFRNSEEY